MYTATMPNPPSTTATYFVTSATFDRRRIFQVKETAALLIETLQHYRAQGHYKLHAFVVMPDHIHLLITPNGGTIERAMQLIKGGFSKKIGSKFPVWQKGYDDRRMRDAEEFIARKRYIHENPVRAHMVADTADYPFSSAYRTRTAAAKAAEEQRL
jgi:putative transposase